MKKTTKKLIVVVVAVLLFGTLAYIDHTTCNKPGSIAEEFNWAGHNCPRE